MNKKIFTLPIAAIIGACIYLWWYSDAKVIHRNSETLLKCFEKNTSDGRFGGVISTSNFKKLLDEDVYFKFEQNDIPYASLFSNSIDKDFLVRSHTGLVNSSGIVAISNKNITISEISGDSANVDLSFYIKTEKLPKNFDHNIKCELTYKKTEGEWKISRALIK